ncbi:nucleotidyltransferase domain-containing protein [Paenibacillus sp. NFR01]|uniref:nucleotidyltransferase domain-containing protein n=1 Tax=Paenibacillus sp. NFR01 TaxID=1566279 RepID=UPI0008C201F7|nr:nucleotidyltransferase domain-containing protein [Paenibacillus sp. NFR01]SEU27935.1 Predicted nucleotidyltransferase [Paenibacillus sp. NFR01]
MPTEIISEIVNALQKIAGVQAIVLGGSRAKGTAHAHSDIDLGIYYDPADGLDIAALNQVASALDDDHRTDLITEVGGWGPWINGGGWLQMQQIPVDWLFRDLGKVSQVMEQCLAGDITIDYQPGHPHGFVNAMYLAEVALCRVLWDPHGLLAELKSKTQPYPPVLQAAMIRKFLWEARFSMEIGRKGIYKQDLSYIAGCCFRAVSCLNQVLFALNETYWMNEKGAVAIADAFSIKPGNYASRVNEMMTLISEDSARLGMAIEVLDELINETEGTVRDEDTNR